VIKRLAALVQGVASNPYALGTAGLILLGRSLQGIIEHAQLVADQVTNVEMLSAQSLHRTVEMAEGARTAADESIDALRTARNARDAAQAAQRAAAAFWPALAAPERAGDVDHQAPAEAPQAR
jgi:hypothetical protein